MAYKVNFYTHYLDGICGAVDWYRVNEILDALSQGIRKNRDFAKKATAKPSLDPVYIDTIWDEEQDIVKNLLGAAFVTCQALITAVVSRVIRLHKYHTNKTGGDLITTNGKREGITRLGSRVVGKSAYTQIQVIDGFANYFKHREQWHRSWDKATGLPKDTIAVIKGVGAKQGSTGNLRHGAKVLGDKSGDKLGKCLLL